MSKKKKKVRVGTISTKDIILNTKERRIRNQSGSGVHGDTKYNRNKQKQLNKKLIDE